MGTIVLLIFAVFLKVARTFSSLRHPSSQVTCPFGGTLGNSLSLSGLQFLRLGSEEVGELLG